MTRTRDICRDFRTSSSTLNGRACRAMLWLRFPVPPLGDKVFSRWRVGRLGSSRYKGARRTVPAP